MSIILMDEQYYKNREFLMKIYQENQEFSLIIAKTIIAALIS
jgi:hypothetical protein